MKRLMPGPNGRGLLLCWNFITVSPGNSNACANDLVIAGGIFIERPLAPLAAMLCVALLRHLIEHECGRHALQLDSHEI